MEPIKCLIVDDDKPAHLVLKSHISNTKELKFTSSVYNGKDAYNSIREYQYDLIFLDIDMPLITGIELMRKLIHRPPVIITTAYSDFAFEAYQNDAVDYLLKPISYPRFLKAIEKAKHFIVTKKDSESKMLSIKHNGDEMELELDSIIYIQSIGNYIKIILINNKRPLIVYQSLKSFYETVSKKKFIQVHKSFIINISFINRVEKEYVILEDNNIPIGRKYGVLLKNIK